VDHLDIVIREKPPELVSPPWMQLKGDDPSSSVYERASERAGTGTHIKNEVARGDASIVNEPFGPPTIESVPSPSCPFPGHGTPS
jgi:hypothetical protein